MFLGNFDDKAIFGNLGDLPRTEALLALGLSGGWNNLDFVFKRSVCPKINRHHCGGEVLSFTQNFVAGFRRAVFEPFSQRIFVQVGSAQPYANELFA